MVLPVICLAENNFLAGRHLETMGYSPTGAFGNAVMAEHHVIEVDFVFVDQGFAQHGTQVARKG